VERIGKKTWEEGRVEELMENEEGDGGRAGCGRVGGGENKKDGWEMWGGLEEVWAVFVDKDAPTSTNYPPHPPCPSPHSLSHG